MPIAREGSTDQDLLEDATNRIEEYLRTQGYRDATAQHARDETNGELTITFTIKKGPLYRVGRMDVSGNASMSLTDLQSHLRVRPGQPFSTAAIDADVATIEDLYRRQGFAAMQADVSFESQPDVAAAVEVPVAIRLAITENVRTVVRTVRVEGLHAIPEADVVSKLGLQPGTPFFVNQMAIDRDAVQLRLANLGYQSATVATTPGLTADGTSADVVFGVREGPQVFVEHVLIVGNERTRTETIERELLLKPGDPLGLERVNESQRRLAALGLFRRARITELAHGDESKRDILVTVEEAPVASVGYGGGFEVGQFLRTDAVTGDATERIEFAPRAFFEIGRRNLFGKNRSINLFTRVSLRNQFQTQVGDNFLEYRVVGTYREPKVFGTAADAALTGTIEQQARTSFDFARRGISAELARRLTRAVSVIGSYQIQRTELFNEPVDPATQVPDRPHLSAAAPVLVFGIGHPRHARRPARSHGRPLLQRQRPDRRAEDRIGSRLRQVVLHRADVRDRPARRPGRAGDQRAARHGDGVSAHHHRHRSGRQSDSRSWRSPHRSHRERSAGERAVLCRR